MDPLQPKPDAPSDEASDEELVAAAREGDVRALEGLLLRHEPRVLRVLRLLGVPAADREDVAQEVLLRVFRHLGTFRAGRSFGGWLYRIVVNAAHDYRTRAARRRRTESDWSEGLEEQPDAGPGPGEIAAGKEGLRRLESVLGELSERERAVFVLCELEGLDSAQAAKALGITSITIRRHLGRARTRLQAALEKKSSGR